MFAARLWLPLLALPWLVAAIWIRKEIVPCYAYAASCLLGIVLMTGISAFAAILPWLDLIPVMRDR